MFPARVRDISNEGGHLKKHKKISDSNLGFAGEHTYESQLRICALDEDVHKESRQTANSSSDSIFISQKATGGKTNRILDKTCGRNREN